MLLRVYDTALFEQFFGNYCVSHWDGDTLIVDPMQAGDPIEAGRLDEAIEILGIRCRPYPMPYEESGYASIEALRQLD